MSRFVVLEDTSAAALEAATIEACGGGAVLVQGWAIRLDAPATVCVGRVETADDASRAMFAAVAGAGLVVQAAAGREVIDRFCDDLRRLGELEHRVGPQAPAPTLTGEERALLGRLLGGCSLGEAARELHLSRRTADRRLASARRALGANSTSEALLLAARAGVAAS